MNNPRDPHAALPRALAAVTDFGRRPQVPVVELLENGYPSAVVGTPPARDAGQAEDKGSFGLETRPRT